MSGYGDDRGGRLGDADPGGRGAGCWVRVEGGGGAGLLQGREAGGELAGELHFDEGDVGLGAEGGARVGELGVEAGAVFAGRAA